MSCCQEVGPRVGYCGTWLDTQEGKGLSLRPVQPPLEGLLPCWVGEAWGMGWRPCLSLEAQQGVVHAGGGGGVCVHVHDCAPSLRTGPGVAGAPSPPSPPCLLPPAPACRNSRRQTREAPCSRGHGMSSASETSSLLSRRPLQPLVWKTGMCRGVDRLLVPSSPRRHGPPYSGPTHGLPGSPRASLTKTPISRSLVSGTPAHLATWGQRPGSWASLALCHSHLHQSPSPTINLLPLLAGPNPPAQKQDGISGC